METVNGIEYAKPTVILLQDTGLGVPEYSARTCYDSFDNSENDSIIAFNNLPDDVKQDHKLLISEINDIDSSDLLGDLAWTYFHHSILEHTNLSFLVKGTSRGVLQEHARHRIQAISVRSTRYTMSSLINAFVVAKLVNVTEGYSFFEEQLQKMNLFVTSEPLYNGFQITDIWNKLSYQYLELGKEEFTKISVAKTSLIYLDTATDLEETFKLLQDGKKKRNVGDAFKHIVNDNWKVDMVVTFNIRSLKNYFTLRDSGAAFFQIKWLAQAMKEATPQKYLDLIVKSK